MLTTPVAALRKIKYYQNKVVEGIFIPPHAFQKLVKEISDKYDVRDKDGHVGKFRWEKDAIFALQAVTEDVLTMIFEMTYSAVANPTEQ